MPVLNTSDYHNNYDTDDRPQAEKQRFLDGNLLLHLSSVVDDGSVDSDTDKHGSREVLNELENSLLHILLSFPLPGSQPRWQSGNIRRLKDLADFYPVRVRAEHGSPNS